MRRVTLTPILDTNIYADGDVLFNPTLAGELAGVGKICAVTLHDKDDEGADLTLYFLRDTASFGTLNQPASISDSDADKITGVLDFAAADYKDLGGVRVAVKNDLVIPVDTRIYVAGVSVGTPTYTTVSDIVIDLWITNEP